MRVVLYKDMRRQRPSTVARQLWTAMTELGPSARDNHEGLPLAVSIPVPTESATHYVVTSLDRDGRLADRSAVQALGWIPGAKITFHFGSGGFLVVRGTNPGVVINGQGHLCLPMSLRRACHLDKGDRVLLVACPITYALVGLPAHSVDQILLHYAATLGVPPHD